MFKENLKRARVEAGLNKAQMAKELGIPWEARHTQAVNALLKLPESQRDAIYTIIETINEKQANT